VEDQKNYAAFIKALELRYGDHHLSQVYQSQLRARVQKSGENLQEFAADVERLVHLAYTNGPAQFHHVPRAAGWWRVKMPNRRYLPSINFSVPFAR
jgi:hypothetical protein